MTLFAEISLLLIIAVTIAGIVHLLRQPIIVGHILTGLLVGPYFLNVVHSHETIEGLSQIGIALLLFIIGLNLNPKVIKEVGKVALIAGLGQMLFTAGVSYLFAQALGFSAVSSLYMALAFSFSSTIIVLKILSDKKDMGRLYGKITVGILLLQDIAATIVLIGISTSGQDKALIPLLTETILKGGFLAALLMGVALFVLPKLSHFFARSQEILFLFSISWGLGIAALFQFSGFSLEIGALLAGVALASSPFSYEISSRLRPLRDFFVILFFVLIGSQIAVGSIVAAIIPTLIFSVLILFGHAFAVIVLMGTMGYSLKTSFKAGLAISQISEFSLILIALALRMGHIDSTVSSIVVLVGVVTMTVSTYFMLYSDQILVLITPFISHIPFSGSGHEKVKHLDREVILFGYDHVGHDFIASFKKLKASFMVVDYDPEIIERLKNDSVDCVYGDAGDNEFLEELNLKKVKLVVSTIADFDVSTIIIDHVLRVNKKAIVILHSDSIDEATALYEKGAAYVMMPHYLGATQTSSLIHHHGFDLSKFIKERTKHLSYLEKRNS